MSDNKNQNDVKSAAHSPKVLLVDDDEALRKILKAVLEKAGYEVHTADNGLTAQRLVGSMAFSAVISDVNMPGSGVGGVALLKHIRLAHPSVPVILMSGYSSLANGEDSFELGVSAFLTKPFKREQLLLALKGGCEHSDSVDEGTYQIDSVKRLQVLLALLVASASGTSGCGPAANTSGGTVSSHNSRMSAIIPVSVLTTLTGHYREGASGQGNAPSASLVDVTVTNDPLKSFKVDFSNLVSVSFAPRMVMLGSFRVEELFDNNLGVCDDSQTEKCSVASVRISQVQTGDGGALLAFMVRHRGATQWTTLDAFSPTILDQMPISDETHVVRGRDFQNELDYELAVDLSDQADAPLSSTLLLEYVLE